MILGSVETILGLLLLNTSFKALNKSVVRKWREGFVFTTFASLIAIIHGLLSFIIELPPGLTSALLIIIFASTSLGVFRIASVKSLEV